MTEHEQVVITKYDLLYEQRMTRVETTLENMAKNMNENFREIKSDLRWMLGLMIMFGGILLGLMAKGFHWL
jgi:hypothetical protein